jgi:plasmid maintenance system antidote protein VapI
MAKSEDLQRHTLRVLTELGTDGKALSARAAGEKLGIGYNQIADMAKGKTPAEKTLIKFASAVGESPTDWLHYAGKHDFAESLGSQEEAPPSQEQKVAQQIAQDLSRVPKERRALLLRQIRALIRATESDDAK